MVRDAATKIEVRKADNLSRTRNLSIPVSVQSLNKWDYLQNKSSSITTSQ